MYRKDVKSFATTNNSRHETLPPLCADRSRVRVDRILALFIETGALYIALMVNPPISLLPQPQVDCQDISRLST